MLPLNASSMSKDDTSRMLDTIAGSGCQGIMVDVWWGICEAEPQVYDFSSYSNIITGCAERGLTVQAAMAFHACGGNVGDSVDIPLPKWVVEKGDEHDMWFLDAAGTINRECICLSADEVKVLPCKKEVENLSKMTRAQRRRSRRKSREKGESKESETFRTPVQAYGDYIRAFVEKFKDHFGKVVTELQVGLGPCGELRYPSYPLDRWEFPGIGEFQCYDKRMLEDLRMAAEGHPKEWGKPPTGTGMYNDTPWSTKFFSKDFESEKGKFFLTWYSEKLLEHGERVLSQVRSVLSAKQTKVELAVKISGIHWWHLSKSKAAEATAGYMRGEGSAYGDIAALLKRHESVLDFTCLEMWTWDQPFWSARAGPEQLVATVTDVATTLGVKVGGENALERYDNKAYRQIEKVYRRRVPQQLVHGFTYLRYNDKLVDDSHGNYRRFSEFVARMKHLQ